MTETIDMLPCAALCWSHPAQEVLFNSPIGLMSKNLTGVLRMQLNIRLCNICAELTSVLNMIKLRKKPKMMVATVKPDKTNNPNEKNIQKY